MCFEKNFADSREATLEMLAYTPLCVYEKGADCLIVGDLDIPKEARKLALTVESATMANVFKNQKRYAIILTQERDVSAKELSEALTEDGILCKSVCGDLKDELTKLGAFFRIVMPYHNGSLIFASNKYHPTADLILDKSDFLEETSYYNSEMHLSSFAIYEKAKKELKGIIKA